METINIYTDASLRNNKIHIGIYISLNGVTLSSKKKYSEKLHNCFNNVVTAEIIGIDSALEFCLKEKYNKIFSNKNIIIHNDNIAAVNNMNSKSIKIGIKNIKKIEKNLNSLVKFKWISRNKNKKADKLSKKYYKYYNISTKVIL